jgi:hypothetical protein
MIVGLGSSKSSIATDNNFPIKDLNDREEIFKNNKNDRASFASSNLGLKPIPKATTKQYNVSDDKMGEKQFIMSIKDILKQSTVKDPREKGLLSFSQKKPTVVNTCSSRCSKSCKCQTTKTNKV